MKSPLIIKKLLNFPINSNCFIISSRNEDCILVDPACGKGEIFDEYFEQNKVKPEYIILTHEHFDHISSVEHIRMNYNSKVIASSICSQNIVNKKRNLSIFYDQVGFECKPADIIIDRTGITFNWNKFDMLFHLTPGHSKGGLCFSIGNNLFTGDTIMKACNPVVKLPGGNLGELQTSIANLMSVYGPDTKVYPGHGDIFRLNC